MASHFLSVWVACYCGRGVLTAALPGHTQHAILLLFFLSWLNTSEGTVKPWSRSRGNALTSLFHAHDVASRKARWLTAFSAQRRGPFHPSSTIQNSWRSNVHIDSFVTGSMLCCGHLAAEPHCGLSGVTLWHFPTVSPVFPAGAQAYRQPNRSAN